MHSSLWCWHLLFQQGTKLIIVVSGCITLKYIVSINATVQTCPNVLCQKPLASLWFMLGSDGKIWSKLKIRMEKRNNITVNQNRNLQLLTLQNGYACLYQFKCKLAWSVPSHMITTVKVKDLWKSALENVFFLSGGCYESPVKSFGWSTENFSAFTTLFLLHLVQSLFT